MPPNARGNSKFQMANFLFVFVGMLFWFSQGTRRQITGGQQAIHENTIKLLAMNFGRGFCLTSNLGRRFA
jgi:hypothetical protein